MCGLVAALSKKGKPAAHRVFELYRKQSQRGMAGYGYLAIENGKLVSEERGLTEAEIKPKLLKEKASFVIFHHRKPTSTNNTLRTTHPMFVSHESLDHDYFIMHNGVITNPRLRKEAHERLGFQYLTEHKLKTIAEYPDGTTEQIADISDKFNDSESLAIDLARYIETDDSRVHAVGAAAFIGIQLEKGTDNVRSVFFGHNYGRELKWQKTRNWVTITSETGDMIEHMKLYSLDLNTKEVTDRELLMDEARPPTYNYGNNTHVGRTHVGGEPQNSLGFDTRNPHHVALPQPANYVKTSLENKFYTFQEMTDTDRGSTAFDIVFLDRGDKKQMFYVPKAFNQDEYALERYEKLEEDHIGALEDMALEYVELEEKEFDRTLSMEEEYRMYEIDEEIRTSPLPADVVENIMRQARDIINWSNEPITN